MSRPKMRPVCTVEIGTDGKVQARGKVEVPMTLTIRPVGIGPDSIAKMLDSLDLGDAKPASASDVLDGKGTVASILAHLKGVDTTKRKERLLHIQRVNEPLFEEIRSYVSEHAQRGYVVDVTLKG